MNPKPDPSRGGLREEAALVLYGGVLPAGEQVRLAAVRGQPRGQLHLGRLEARERRLRDAGRRLRLAASEDARVLEARVRRVAGDRRERVRRRGRQDVRNHHRGGPNGCVECCRCVRAPRRRARSTSLPQTVTTINYTRGSHEARYVQFV